MFFLLNQQTAARSPGMFCRERKWKEGVYVTCVLLQRCSQLECDKGYVCTETEAGPTCNLPSSCEEASCVEGMVCTTFSVPSHELTVAQCVSQNVAANLPVFGSDFSCSSDVMICNDQTEACTEVFEDGRFLTLTCNIVNCTESSCPSNRECTEIPDDLVQELEIQFRHSCSLPGFVYSETCASAASLCPLGLACHDVVFEETTIGIGCGVSAPTYSGLSCEELACPAPLECYESIVEGRGSLAQCVPDESLDIIIEEISHTTG